MSPLLLNAYGVPTTVRYCIKSHNYSHVYVSMVSMTFATWLCNSSLGCRMSLLCWYWVWSYNLLWRVEYGISNVPLPCFSLKKAWIYSLYLWNLCLCYEKRLNQVPGKWEIHAPVAWITSLASQYLVNLLACEQGHLDRPAASWLQVCGWTT